MISSSGQALTRPAAFQFALDPTLDQRSFFAQCAGARRFTFNHHLGRVKQNLDVRAGEREAKLAAPDMTPGLSWSKFSFINEFNAWKNDLARFVRVTRPGVCVVRQAGRWEDDVALVDLGLDSAGVAGLSSTEVRARVASGASIEHMVDPAVAAYIERGGLYRDLACHSLRHRKPSASYSL